MSSAENQPLTRSIYGDVLKVMQGSVTSPEEVISFKNPNEPVHATVQLVQEGSGLIGLENVEDNKEWSGLFNHVLLTARVASHLGRELQKVGEHVDINLLKAAILSSHSGRRMWDESNWYKDAVPDYKSKQGKTDTDLTLDLLRKAQLPEELIETVEAHAIGNPYPYEKMDTWEKKLALYADFRVSQIVTTLNERFNDLQERGVTMGRFTQQWIDDTRNWAQGVEDEIFSKLENIKPESITNDNPPMPLWEGYLRRLYIQDAEAGIFNKISKFEEEINRAATEEEKVKAKLQMETDFPVNTWWGRYVRELFYNRKEPSRKSNNKNLGISRAIEYYSSKKK